MIAALFVEKRGVYYGLPEVDPWDESRDARLYAGPWPVVAHPPCRLWTNFAILNYKRYGGRYNQPGNDGGCFASALASVERFGGVLEHPAFSRAWSSFRLDPPMRGTWQRSRAGFVCEVWQSAYGHRARKRTWLYYVGSEQPPELDWSRPTGTHQIGWFDRIKPTLSKCEASRTPVAFRDELIRLAYSSVPHPAIACQKGST